MHRRALSLTLALILAACHGGSGPRAPAAEGVKAYMATLKNTDPSDAYALMSAEARKKISPAEFALQWKQSEKERAWQAQMLAQSVKGNPNVGERAVVSFSDGKLVELQRDGDAWRLESDRVGRSQAKEPRDAIRIFADAVANRDVTALLGSLTQRRRDGLTKQIEGFIGGLGRRINDRLDQWSDRAELRWDEAGLRYRIVLRREDDEWRVDDIVIRPAPKDEEPADKTSVDGVIPQDY